MDFSLAGLIIALFAILPGFVSTAVRQMIAPAESKPDAGEWVARSIVASLAFNLPVALVLVAPGLLGQDFAGIPAAVGKLPTQDGLTYLTALYGLAAAWGVVAGITKNLAPRRLAYRFGLTPISPAPNVFIAVLEGLFESRANRRLRGTAEQLVPWLRIERKDKVIVGRLRKGSVAFALDNPIEIFLSPAFTVAGGAVVAREPFAGGGNSIEGTYLRILPDDVVDIFTAREDWRLPARVPPAPGAEIALFLPRVRLIHRIRRGTRPRPPG